MTVTVLLFASAAAQAGSRQITLELSSGATVEDLSEALALQIPSLRPLLSISRWAIDRRLVTGESLVQAEQEIALIPPVSGG